MLEDTFPKVLVISDNCFSTDKNNGKTFQNIFKNWPIDKLAQFYIWPEIPNSNVCATYYRLTDLECLHALFKKNSVMGSIVKSHDINSINTSGGVYGSSWKNWSVSRFLREFIWRSKFWKQRGLIDWVNQYDPDVVFFVGIHCAFLYRIAYYICKTKDIPLVVYCTDDYYLPRFSLSVFYHLHRMWLVKWTKKLLRMEKTSLVTINEFMQERYKKKFHKDSRIIMNLIGVPELCPSYQDDSDRKIKIVYIGNLGHNRWKVLKNLAEAVMNSQYADKFMIEVYLGIEPTPKELKAITNPPYINYYGKLNAEQVKQKQLEADILLHVEAFDYKSRRNVQLSLSTKITEYMAAGRPVLAIGPGEVASIRFLKKYAGAYCITELNKDNIEDVLAKMTNYSKRKEMGYQNWKCIRSILNENKVEHIIKAR